MGLIPLVKGYDDEEYLERVLDGAEIVVGIPSRNSGHTILYVIKQAAEGLARYYGGRRVAIVVCDGLSTDNTVEIVKTYRSVIDTPIAVIPNVRAPGKGAAVRTIIEAVSSISNADALVLLDSDLRSVTPEWIPLLVRGAVECGFAAPLYRRHRFDATITNFVARPVTAMAYGVDIRQPIGGDFGLSRGLVDLIASSRLWTSNPWTQLFGVDIFITHTALASDIGVCEALLKAKIHEAKEPSKTLKGMFIEVTGSLFTVLIEYRESWVRRGFTELESPGVIDEPEAPEMAPCEVRVDPESAKKVFHHGLSAYRSLYERALPRDVYDRIYSSEIHGDGLTPELWAQCIYGFFKYFTREPSIVRREASLEALFHLWQGRLYRYYSEVDGVSDSDVDRILRDEVKAFTSIRDLFIEAAEALG